MALPLGESSAHNISPHIEDPLTAQNPGLSLVRIANAAEIHEPEDITTQELTQDALSKMRALTTRFKMEVATTWQQEPPTIEERKTRVSFKEVLDTTEYASPSGWRPAKVTEYSSYDPWQEMNPGLTKTTTDLIEGTTLVAVRLGRTRRPTLAYLNIRRGGHGKAQTIITKAMGEIDPIMKEWIDNLPDPERLRPVAHPWSDTETAVYDKEGNLTRTPMSLELNALVGGSNDGRGVREREAWERAIVAEHIDPNTLPNKTLSVTSLGTGTGEPVMDTALSVLDNGATRTAVVVNGFDIKESSLRTAAYIAGQKQATLYEGNKLVFNGRIANLLSEDGVRKAVTGTQPQIVESIGFSEYVPSDGAPTTEEQAQRALMKRGNNMSAQEWYKTIYDAMPEGSHWLTGNMRNDSPQLSFVTDVLGWQGIIARDTKDYLRILEQAGIPSEAVHLYVPGAESSRVYNLVKITKPFSHEQ